MEEPLFRRDALAAGRTDAELRRAVRRGDLTRLTPGVYLDSKGTRHLDDIGRHAIHARAAGVKLGSCAALSHISAAVLHGFDVWRTDLGRVHVTNGRDAGGQRSATRYVHAGRLDGDVVELDGVRVTSPARTVVDLARTVSADEAVVIGDSALRSFPGLCYGGLLDVPRTGIAAARRVIGFLDGRSESPGESLGRLRLRDSGIPDPDLQRIIRTPRGVFVARVDYFWERWGIVGEFDGMAKYEGVDDVRAEKRREDALRDLGFEVVRWTWPELFRFETVVARFERALRRIRSAPSDPL
ncbi:type IV toxin-antitoxin system AbiEi family antitoxin domain-containing protein [Rhodococcus zopfii]|uniref:type IV toxin-antitoxin system AbiEi family antitoxin domain-containing protein n=1 Tax=Rhodococcus zopfii TaxID=43772 RepID=UPI0011114764|nr:type IV toxin-antitoxin system AbiEi family antitoxin domain-containing protein [Rhodococcus zopfii]